MAGGKSSRRFPSVRSRSRKKCESPAKERYKSPNRMRSTPSDPPGSPSPYEERKSSRAPKPETPSSSRPPVEFISTSKNDSWSSEEGKLRKDNGGSIDSEDKRGISKGNKKWQSKGRAILSRIKADRRQEKKNGSRKGSYKKREIDTTPEVSIEEEDPADSFSERQRKWLREVNRSIRTSRFHVYKIADADQVLTTEFKGPKSPKSPRNQEDYHFGFDSDGLDRFGFDSEEGGRKQRDDQRDPDEDRYQLKDMHRDNENDRMDRRRKYRDGRDNDVDYDERHRKYKEDRRNDRRGRNKNKDPSAVNRAYNKYRGKSVDRGAKFNRGESRNRPYNYESEMAGGARGNYDNKHIREYYRDYETEKRLYYDDDLSVSSIQMLWDKVSTLPMTCGEGDSDDEFACGPRTKPKSDPKGHVPPSYVRKQAQLQRNMKSNVNSLRRSHSWSSETSYNTHQQQKVCGILCR